MSGAVLLLLQPGSVKAQAVEAATVTERYVAMAIQGDLSGAVKLFNEAPRGEYPAVDELRRDFEARFISADSDGGTSSTGPFLDAVIDTYRRYWRHGLLQGVPVADDVLGQQLHALLASSGRAPVGNTDVFASLRSELSAVGVHFLEGSALPLRDLFIWQSEKIRRFSVRLTDRKVTLNVHFMGEFRLQGWKDFASLGRVTTTGWVDKGELYCLADAYDISTERFEISYLKHEARHLVDLELYPEMSLEDLEYRAKLTELAFANRSLPGVLEDFTAKAAQNPGSPHAMANWRVSRDVHYQLYGVEMNENSADWSSIDVGIVNRVARKLLKRDEMSRKNRAASFSDDKNG